MSLRRRKNPEAPKGWCSPLVARLADVVFDVRERAYRVNRSARSLEPRDGVWLAWDLRGGGGRAGGANGWLQRVIGSSRAVRMRQNCRLAMRSGVFGFSMRDPTGGNLASDRADRQASAHWTRDGWTRAERLCALTRRHVRKHSGVGRGHAAVLEGEMRDRVLIGSPADT